MAKIFKQLVKQLIRTQFPEGLRINIDQGQGTVTVYQGNGVLSEMSFAEAQAAVNSLFGVDPAQEPDQDVIDEPGAI